MSQKLKLAELIRPQKLSEIIGQTHLLDSNGIVRKMVEKNHFLSFILWGPSGTGKNTIINLLIKQAKLESDYFNASNSSKDELKKIFSSHSKPFILVLDEFHRLMRNIQEFLLEPLEKGEVIIFGLSNENPYYNINLNIRSRLLLLETKSLNSSELRQVAKRALQSLEQKITLSTKQLDYLITKCEGDARALINYIEALGLYSDEDFTVNDNIINQLFASGNLQLDKLSHHYLLLSALQKSIRGSDADASIYYLGQLIMMEDLEAILRRLVVIAYEDIGLANPNLASRVIIATNACRSLGIGESRIILANLVIEMAISPKSNSAYLAIDKVLNSKLNYTVPDFLDNFKIKQGEVSYFYPHDSSDGLTSDNYLPFKIKNEVFYKPKLTSNFEKQLSERLKIIDNKRLKRR